MYDENIRMLPAKDDASDNKKKENLLFCILLIVTSRGKKELKITRNISEEKSTSICIFRKEIN